MRALVGLARCRHIGVVAADDHHGVTTVGHLVVAVDDIGDGRVRIIVQLLITRADALFVGQAHGGVRQQQIEDVVAILAQPGDRAEHPTRATVAANRCMMPSAIVDLPVSPSGEAT